MFVVNNVRTLLCQSVHVAAISQSGSQEHAERLHTGFLLLHYLKVRSATA